MFICGGGGGGVFCDLFIFMKSNYKKGEVHPWALQRPIIRKVLTMEEQVRLLCDVITWSESFNYDQALEENTTKKKSRVPHLDVS